MVIISRTAINRFIEKYPHSKDPLLKWFLDVFEADWKNIAELKNRFPTADYVGNNLFVFDIGGNKWRLIARIIFLGQERCLSVSLVHMPSMTRSISPAFDKSGDIIAPAWVLSKKFN